MKPRGKASKASKATGNQKPKGGKKSKQDIYEYMAKKIRNAKNRAGDSDDSEDEKLEEDESIDDEGSEVGWNSDDELAYGHIFRKNKKKQDDEDDGEESDQEVPFEGEILLSDLLESNLGGAKKPDVKKSSSKVTSEDEDDMDEDSEEDGDGGGWDLGDDDEDALKIDDDADEEDDEEEDDDDDDEDDEDTDDDEGTDDDEEDDDDEEAHNRLMSAIESFGKVDEKSSGAGSTRKNNRASQSAQESVFSSMADEGAVSMDALLGALGDAKALNVAKKQLSELEKAVAAPTFVEKVVSDRVERNLAYEGAATEMTKWQDTVTANRHERTLDLAKDKRQLPNYRDLVKKFTPETDMEKEVQMVLIKTNATDAQAERREEDELGRRNMSAEELKERQAELAKVKALMFYEQMKRHRINKIKSKAYRKIRKRQRLRQEEAEKELLEDLDPEQAQELTEKEALRRVKERMDMKHRNTSKWARMALEHGKHDPSLRAAYHEAVQLGQELKKKIDGEPASSSSRRRGEDGDDDGADWSSDDDAGKGFQTEGVAGKKKNVSARAAKELLHVLEGAEDAPEAQGKYKKLFEMDFMKRAADQQRERAREEAQKILREIEDMERIEGGGDDGDGAASNTADSAAAAVGGGNTRSKRKERSESELAAAKEEMSKLLGSGQGMSLRGGMALKPNAQGVKVSGPISVAGTSAAKSKASSSSSSNQAAKGAVQDDYDENYMPWDAIETGAGDNNAGVGASADGEDGAANPWLSAGTSAGNKKRSATAGGQVIHAKSAKKDKADAEKVCVSVTAPSTNKSTASATTNATAKKSTGANANAAAQVEALINKDNNEKGVKPTAGQKRPHPSDGSAQDTSMHKAAKSDKSADNAVAAGANAAKGSAAERKPLLMQKSQEDLVQIAFAGPDFESDFVGHKNQTIDEELGIEEKKKKILSDVKAGWGDWAGPGNMVVSNKILNTRNRLMKKVEDESDEMKKTRKDTKTPNVMISERRVKTAAKYKVADIPHPFTSREEYERSLLMPLGAEWNASNVVKSNTMPEVLLRAGRIVEPIALPKGQKKPSNEGGNTATTTSSSSSSAAAGKGHNKGKGGAGKR